jgi:uncharacterized protein (DUF1778 family)
MDATKKRGRPPGLHPRTDHRLDFRLSTPELDLIKQAAKSAGLSVSEAARAASLAWASRQLRKKSTQD